jgi:hypothetical protein
MQYTYKRDGTLQTSIKRDKYAPSALLALHSFSGIENFILL